MKAPRLGQIAAALLASAALSVSAHAQQTVLNFDDLSGFAPMPAGYGGIANWGSWAYNSNPDVNYPSYSPPTRIISVGLQQPILFGQSFIFDGCRVVTAVTFSMQLYYQGGLVHTTGSVTPNLGGPALWLPSGYTGPVDELRYVASVNVFAVDDFSYSALVQAPTAYCTAGTTTNGCNASVAATANPSLTSLGCSITASNVEGQRTGLIFYGLSALIQPWATGSTSFLCVKPPTQRTLLRSSGGTNGQCDGTLALDWDAFQAANPAALGQPWGAGSKAFVQGWFRDPAAPKTTNLSNALELTYLP